MSQRDGAPHHLAWNASHYDRHVNLGVIQAAHLLKQPHQLLSPRLLWGITRYVLRRITLGRLPGMAPLPEGAKG